MVEVQQSETTGDLFESYVRFMADMSEGRTAPLAPYNQEEFAAWLSGLDVGTREICIRDFRMGYAAALAECERQVAEVVAKYREPQD